MQSFSLRPREGWRAFAGEVGVIVLGVLIALGAQQVVNDWQWRRDAQTTKAALDDEIRSNAVEGVERLALRGCLQGRLKQLAAKVAASDGQWVADPLKLGGTDVSVARTNFALPLVYRAPSRTFTGDDWEQAKANGALAHMSRSEVLGYAVIYQQIDNLRAINGAELAAMSGVAALAFDGALSADGRERALGALATLDRLNTYMMLNAEQVVEAAIERGGRLSALQERRLRENLEGQTRLRGPCVDGMASLRAIAPLRSGSVR